MSEGWYDYWRRYRTMCSRMYTTTMSRVWRLFLTVRKVVWGKSMTTRMRVRGVSSTGLGWRLLKELLKDWVGCWWRWRKGWPRCFPRWERRENGSEGCLARCRGWDLISGRYDDYWLRYNENDERGVDDDTRLCTVLGTVSLLTWRWTDLTLLSG